MRFKFVYDPLLRQIYCYVFEEKDGEDEIIDIIPCIDEEGEDEEKTTH